jgi:hypothetical protein
MTYRTEFVINQLPVSGNKLLRMHWAPRNRYNNEWYDLVRMFGMRFKPPSALQGARISFIRCGSRHLDYDNLTTSFKPVLDGLVKSGFLVDDSTKIVKEIKYSFQQVKIKDSRIVIIIEGID